MPNPRRSSAVQGSRRFSVGDDVNCLSARCFTPSAPDRLTIITSWETGRDRGLLIIHGLCLSSRRAAGSNDTSIARSNSALLVSKRAFVCLCFGLAFGAHSWTSAWPHIQNIRPPGTGYLLTSYLNYLHTCVYHTKSDEDDLGIWIALVVEHP